MRKILIVALFTAARMISAQAYKPAPMLLYDSSGNPFPTGSGTALSFTPPAFTCYTIVTGSVVPCTFSGGGGSGTVTSFSAGNLSPLFTTSVATATTTPALSFALSTASANTVFSGPTTGAAAAPTFRVLVAGDIPTGIPIANIGSAGLSGTSPITISSAGAIACPTCNTSSANVISVSGDGTIINNSASTGAVTLTLANTPTGTGSVVLATSPTLVTPALGTPSALVITNATGTCTACTANVAGSVTNALTLNNSNSGAASGTTYNGSAAVTLSANTLGAGSLTNANTWSAAQTISAAGAASTSALLLSGAWETGGSATTTYPGLYVKDATASDGNLSANGNGLVVNAASGFTGDLIILQVNGGSPTLSATPSGISATTTFTGTTIAASTVSAIGSTLANAVRLGNTGVLGWSSTSSFSGGNDTTLCRSAAGVVEVGSSTGCATSGSISATGIIGGSFQQQAASNSGGTCSMSTSTSCTITIGHTYTTPVCIVTQQSATLTGGAAGCTVSSTTVTITAAVANSETWGAFVFGNPN
jgi:hypothetical protein